MKTYISENIRGYRLVKRLTQLEFGKLLGVSPQAVSKWENGTAFPDILLLPDIARMIGVTIDELITEDISGDMRLN